MLWWHRVIRCRFLVRRSYLQALFGGKGHPLQNDPQIDGLLRNPFRMVNSKTMDPRRATIEEFAPEYAHRALLPAMAHDEVEADSVGFLKSRWGSPSHSYQRGCAGRSAAVSFTPSSRGDWKGGSRWGLEGDVVISVH